MKLLLLSLFVAGSLHAQTFSVIVRQDHSTRTYHKDVQLEDLESADSFEGKYFRVVKGKTNEPVSFHDSDKEIVSKAANAYYHLTEARHFWVDKIGAERVKTLPKLIVRLDITNLFDDQGHYANDHRDPQFNNALSIPGGRTPDWVPQGREDQWGPEIWFRPKKVVSTRDMIAGMGPNPLTQSLAQLEHPVINYAQQQLQISMIERMVYPSYATGSIQTDLIRFAGTIALTHFLVQSSRRLDPFFVEKWFYIDTAMVPEVVYHEYSHIVLSDKLAITHSTPVIEGMADYFAAALANKRKVYDRVPGRSNSEPKDPHNSRPYSHWDESDRTASSDFVLSVLWDVRELLGEEIGNKLIYQARNELSTDTATVSDHLLRAILVSCETVCESPRTDKLRLYETFSKRGF
ncbi:MAG: hypothetical protein ACJ76H_12735 [Bacteriovoracaceae bacterium]